MAVCLVAAEDGQSIVLDKAVVLIGRHPDCDVVLTDSRKISRKHCCLAQVNNSLVVRDLGSTNGVWVNGERVDRQLQLRLGDEISFGDVPFRLLEQESPGQKKTPHAQQRERAKNGRNAPIVSTPNRVDLSQEIPVPIPEEGESFIVEPSMGGDPGRADEDDDFFPLIEIDEDPT